jgi:toxin-antitoxin system PIN domain toxin
VIIFDANVLIYAHHQASPHHHTAKQHLEEALSGTQTVGFPWSVISAFLRIITNPRAFEHPLSMRQACIIVNSWLDAEPAVCLEAGSRHWEIFQGLLLDANVRGNLVTDAHIAALAIEHQAVLLSRDRDFTRFPGLHFRPLAE